MVRDKVIGEKAITHTARSVGKGPHSRDLQRVICRITNRIFVGAPLCP
jgi:hypothetical protein